MSDDKVTEGDYEEDTSGLQDTGTISEVPPDQRLDEDPPVNEQEAAEELPDIEDGDEVTEEALQDE